jgi:hypothetical protein
LSLQVHTFQACNVWSTWTGPLRSMKNECQMKGFGCCLCPSRKWGFFSTWPLQSFLNVTLVIELYRLFLSPIGYMYFWDFN